MQNLVILLWKRLKDTSPDSFAVWDHEAAGSSPATPTRFLLQERISGQEQPEKGKSVTARVYLIPTGMTEIQKLHIRFCEYSEVFKGNTKSTIQWLKSDFSQFVKFTQIEQISEVSKQGIESWIINGKIYSGWSAKTITLRMQSLGLFLDWCVGEKLLTENPIKAIPKPKLPLRIPEHLTLEEAENLLDWAKNFPYEYKFERSRSVAIMATFIYTGLRKQELRNLRVTDVDIENKTLIVKSGKGNKDRIVPLNRALIEELEVYLKDRKRMKKNCPYFFTAMRQDSQMGDNVIKRLVEKIRTKSGIKFYPHMLRHTFATLMLEGGCNLYALSKMLGHSDIKTTTIYLSATRAHLQEQIGKHPLSR